VPLKVGVLEAKLIDLACVCWLAQKTSSKLNRMVLI
jgi:hypothetical protein